MSFEGMKREIWRDARPLSEIDGVPLHRQLREVILGKIKSGELLPGDLVPPEIQLADVYGVSRTTARRALLDLTREGYLHRVSGKGTYVARPRPEGIKAVVFLCDFNHRSMANLAAGIEAVVRSVGYELIVRNTQGDADSEIRQLDEVRGMDISGLILWPRAADSSGAFSEAVRALKERSIPAVIVDQYTPDADCVTTDNFGGAYLAAEHLLRLGRTRLGFVAHPGSLAATVQARWSGMQEALLNYGVEVDDRRLFNEELDPERLGEWLARERLDGLLCANDNLAIKVIDTLTRVGVTVPERVSVVGYDDLPVAEATRPALTTVHQGFKAVGRSAGRLLVERIEEPGRPPRHRNLPVRLIVRDSCGAGMYSRRAALAVT